MSATPALHALPPASPAAATPQRVIWELTGQQAGCVLGLAGRGGRGAAGRPGARQHATCRYMLVCCLVCSVGSFLVAAQLLSVLVTCA